MPWAPITRVPSPLPANSQTRGGMWFLQAALIGSHTFGAFSNLLASALNAQSRVAGFESLPLAREQWKVEAEQLFAISLARIQVNARNIARGVAKAYPGYQKQVRENEFCNQTYMFNSEGWTNVNWAGWVGISVVCCVVIVVAIPAGDDEKLFWEVLYDLAIKLWHVCTPIFWAAIRTVRRWSIWSFVARLFWSIWSFVARLFC